MSDVLLFPRYGVITKAGDPAFADAVLRVTGTQPGSSGIVNVALPDKTNVEYNCDQITQDTITGRLEFASDGETYRIRELREDDGEWLSSLKVSLPIFALTGLINQGATMATNTGLETFTAYALDDSVYVVGLIYSNGIGRWSRVDGDWNLLSSTDDIFSTSVAMDLDPKKADEYIDLFDKNYVTITDTEAYELPEPVVPEDEAPNVGVSGEENVEEPSQPAEEE